MLLICTEKVLNGHLIWYFLCFDADFFSLNSTQIAPLEGEVPESIFKF